MHNGNDTQNESMFMAEAHELVSPNINSKNQQASTTILNAQKKIGNSIEKEEKEGGWDANFSEDLSSSDHSSDRRKLDIEIHARTAIFRKPTFHNDNQDNKAQKLQLALNAVDKSKEIADYGKRDDSAHNPGRVRQSSFSFRKRGASASEFNKSEGEDNNNNQKEEKRVSAMSKDTIEGQPEYDVDHNQ